MTRRLGQWLRPCPWLGRMLVVALAAFTAWVTPVSYASGPERIDPARAPSDAASSPVGLDFLAVSGATAVPNDDFDAAIQINSLPYDNQQDTTAATEAVDDPVFADSCGGQQRFKTVWYRYTPAEDETLTVDTADDAPEGRYDTVLAIWTGSRNALNCEACNDDPLDGGVHARIDNVPVAGGVTYYIEVAHHWGNDTGGHLHLAVTTVADIQQKVFVPLVVKGQ
jgi:hypothetical protein